MEIVITERFLNRLEECKDYIALGHIPTAIKWANSIFDYCEQLKSQPESGRVVPEFSRPEIRELIQGDYRLIYELKNESNRHAYYLAYESDVT